MARNLRDFVPRKESKTHTAFDINEAFASLLDGVQLDTQDTGGSVTFTGEDPILPSNHRLGAIMAITTSLNPTLIVPSRLALIFVEDGLAPRWLGYVNRRTATPIWALTLTLLACLVLLVSKQLSLALNIAVFALILLYFLHSVVFLMLPRWNSELNREISINLPVWVQRTAAWLSVLSMGGLILVQLVHDSQTLRTTSLSQRISGHSLTSLELAIVWGLIGVALYAYARSQKRAAKL